MRRALLGLAIATLAAVATAPVATASEADLTKAGDATFPRQQWLLNLEGGAQRRASGIEVREDDRPVRNLRVVPASEAGGRATGTVLVIDTSKSMRGEPITAAMEAARAFARERKPNQPLGVVFFSGKAAVTLVPTTDSTAIASALAGEPRLDRGTQIYDGVAAALGVLRRERIGAGSIVVMSDGDDTGSRAGREQVVAAADRQRVRVFGVGLRSNSFDGASLEGLAHATGATFAVADSTEDLRDVFKALGSRLANEFHVSYDSSEPLGKPVRVTVDVDGDEAPEAAANYTAPRVPDFLGDKPAATSANSFWLSADSAILVPIVSALLLALAYTLAFWRPSRSALHERIAAFAPEGRATVPVEGGTLFSGVGTLLDVRFAQTRLWVGFKENVSVAGFRRSAGTIAAASIVASVAVFVLLALVGAGPMAFIALLLPIVSHRVAHMKAQKQRRMFGDQLADNLQVCASALRAGHSFSGALAVVVDDAPEPARREFRRVVTDEQLGVQIDDALIKVSKRMRNRDLGQVAVVAGLQQETGGNTAEVLDRVVDAIRERAELRRMVSSLTAQGRMTRWVVTALPPGLALIVSLMQPGYLSPLIEKPFGRILLVAAVLMVVSGSYAIKRIVDIKV